MAASQSCVWVVTEAVDIDVIQNLKQGLTFSGSASLPSCLTQYLDQQCHVGVSFVVEGVTYTPTRSSSPDESDQLWNLCAQVDGYRLGKFFQASDWGDLSIIFMGLHAYDYFYIDANCHAVPVGANRKLCGIGAVLANPISFTWEIQ